MYDNNGPGQSGRCGTGKKVDLVEIPNGFDMGCRIRGNSKITSKLLT